MESKVPFIVIIILMALIVYIFGLCIILRISDSNKTLKVLKKIYVWPATCLVRFLPCYQHFILNFIVVLLMPFAFFIVVLKGLVYLDILHLNDVFIIFIALSISAILSLFRGYGQVILEIVGLGKIYRRSKLDDYYNAKTTKFIMYLIYFLFLFISFARHFYNECFSVPEYASASFIIYLAADRLLSNRHLCQLNKV